MVSHVIFAPTIYHEVLGVVEVLTSVVMINRPNSIVPSIVQVGRNITQEQMGLRVATDVDYQATARTEIIATAHTR